MSGFNADIRKLMTSIYFGLQITSFLTAIANGKGTVKSITQNL